MTAAAVRARVPGVVQPHMPPTLPESVVEALVTVAERVQDGWDTGAQQHRDVPTCEPLATVICGSWNTWTLHQTAKALRDAWRASSWQVDNQLGLLSCAARTRENRSGGEHSLGCDHAGTRADPEGCCGPAAGDLVDEFAARLLVTVAGLLGRDVSVLAVELAGRTS